MRKLYIEASKKGDIQEVNKMLKIMLPMVVQTMLVDKDIFYLMVTNRRNKAKRKVNPKWKWGVLFWDKFLDTKHPFVYDQM